MGGEWGGGSGGELGGLGGMGGWRVGGLLWGQILFFMDQFPNLKTLGDRF